MRTLTLILLVAFPGLAMAQTNDPDPQSDDDGDGVVEFFDCDDLDPDRGIGEAFAEWCDGKDNDCDESTDETVDGDGDGQAVCDGDCNDRDEAVNAGDADEDGVSGCDGDCDDTDPALNPFDEDQDGLSTCDPLPDCDDTDPAANYDDLDGDGFATCDAFADCDDTDPEVGPETDEACGDGIDNDCSGEADDLDEDGDGAVSPDCGGDDCNDGNAAIDPGTPEGGVGCTDAIDNDCDGAIDNGDEDCFEAPDVDAGPDVHERYLGGTVLVALDGSGTTDANTDDELTYTWVLDGPAEGYPGVSVELVHDPSSPVGFLRFSAEPGTELSTWEFALHLEVTDGALPSDPEDEDAQLIVTVSRPTVYNALPRCSAAGAGGAGLLALGLVGGLRRRRR